MACPFFMPEQRLNGDWPFPQRLPLAAGWSGTCTAVPGSEVRPNEHELTTSCNMGYARQCARLPQQRPADAVRFAKGEEHDGLIHIRFAYERDYLPAGHGELIYETATHQWQTAHDNACLLRMAECYINARLLQNERGVLVFRSGESLSASTVEQTIREIREHREKDVLGASD